MTDTSIEFRSTFGSSYICASDKANSRIALPPAVLAKGSALTNWSTLGIAKERAWVNLY